MVELNLRSGMRPGRPGDFQRTRFKSGGCARIEKTIDHRVYRVRPMTATFQGAVLLTVGRSYVGNDVTHSTLLDRACACSYKNLPKYRPYRVSNTAPGATYC